MSAPTRLLRYFYPDGRLQAALPMYVVEERADLVVGWLPTGSEISYWATADGLDPRTVPLDRRFTHHLTTARRSWSGSGILRVVPFNQCWQVLHFWNTDSGEFMGWYVNLESKKTRDGVCIDAIDWHLDLLISPSLAVTWKDEDEAAAAANTPYLRASDLDRARAVGEAIAANPQQLLDLVGDWRQFRPQPEWAALSLPSL